MRRLAHSHQNYFLHRRISHGVLDLTGNLQIAQLSDQTAFSGHTEDAADSTSDLRGYTDAFSRKKHAFNQLAVGGFENPARAGLGFGFFLSHQLMS